MLDDTFNVQFWPAVWATITGGFFITLVFFSLREFLFSMPRVSGVWMSEFTVENSSHGPFKGMTVIHRVVLLQKGAEISGSGEKDSERSSKNGEMSYEGKGRTQVKIYGFIEKKIFGPDRIHICWDDDGRIRRSAAFFDLKISGCKNKGDLFGGCYTSAGECYGHARWQRITKYKNKF